MPDTTNGRLWFENMIMYKLGLSSYSAKFILLRSRKRKMTAGSGSREFTLEELACLFRCLTGGARECPVKAW